MPPAAAIIAAVHLRAAAGLFRMNQGYKWSRAQIAMALLALLLLIIDFCTRK